MTRQHRPDRGVVDVAVHRDHLAVRSQLAQHRQRAQVAGVHDQVGARAAARTHASGSRRSPRGMCVSEMIAISTKLPVIFPDHERP